MVQPKHMLGWTFHDSQLVASNTVVFLYPRRRKGSKKLFPPTSLFFNSNYVGLMSKMDPDGKTWSVLRVVDYTIMDSVCSDL